MIRAAILRLVVIAALACGASGAALAQGITVSDGTNRAANVLNLNIAGGGTVAGGPASSATITIPSGCTLSSGTCTFANPIAAPGVNVTGTGTALTVSNGTENLASASFAWSGSATTQAPLYMAPNWTGGTSTIAGDYTPIGIYLNLNDSVIATAGNGTSGIYLEEFVGSGHQGPADGIASTLKVVGAQTNSGKEYFAVAGSTYASVSLNNGNLYGGNFGAHITTNGTSVNTASASEFGVESYGTAPTNLYGIYIMKYSDSTVQGSTSDSGVVLYNQAAQSSTYGWKCGLCFGTGGQYFPITTTGKLISAVKGSSDSALTAGSLIDFSAISTVTGYDINMPNFSVAGSGQITAALATSGTIAGAVCATSGGLLLYESGATGCTISLAAIKHSIAALGKGHALHDIMALQPSSYGFNDPKMPQHRYGFIADQVHVVDPMLSTYDGAGKLQAFDPNGILALTVAVVQQQEWEIRALMLAGALLTLWCAGLTVVVRRRL